MGGVDIALPRFVSIIVYIVLSRENLRTLGQPYGASKSVQSGPAK
jgi:hypothetical protein